MPTGNPRREREPAIQWLRAAVFGGATLGSLLVLPFYPATAAPILALTVGALALFSPGLAVLAFVVALTLPLMAANILVGGMVLVVGVAAVQYFGQDDAKAFTVMLLAFIAVRFGAAWGVVALAGYVLGTAEGAVAVLIACLAIEAAGVLLGKPNLGSVVTGGSPENAIVSLERLRDVAANDPLAFGWLIPAVKAVDPGRVLAAFTGASHVALLVVQPLAWAGGAAMAGSLKRRDDDPRRALVGIGAAVAAALALALASIAAVAVLGGGVDAGFLVTSALFSALVAVGGAAVWELVFPPLPAVQRPRAEPRRGGMSAEDADVDELLSLIASAEEELASKHTTTAVVMITDMKSFSKMTEEEGSVMSAKLIQRHRDLLIPIITKHGGNGKSTGGDGLVAAFRMESEALAAAVEMQQALAGYNASKTSERELQVRIGIASGELVLDKGGRPFIGAALNMAARVMNLADGGQVMTVDDVVTNAEAGRFRLHSHGRFDLKNIAHPVVVYEVLWAEGQEPVIYTAPTS
ncbi:MAG: hypothetical protein C0418_04080 [Coriobacteriaceae bacterium]|nr:hypothetical protein [Coriobacteriaceae bacterium]